MMVEDSLMSRKFIALATEVDSEGCGDALVVALALGRIVGLE